MDPRKAIQEFYAECAAKDRERTHRTLKRGDRRPKGYQVRAHGTDGWGPGQQWLVGRKITNANLEYGEYRAPLKPKK